MKLTRTDKAYARSTYKATTENNKPDQKMRHDAVRCLLSAVKPKSSQDAFDKAVENKIARMIPHVSELKATALKEALPLLALNQSKVQSQLAEVKGKQIDTIILHGLSALFAGASGGLIVCLIGFFIAVMATATLHFPLAIFVAAAIVGAALLVTVAGVGVVKAANARPKVLESLAEQLVPTQPTVVRAKDVQAVK
jgi:hypothetical protein